MAESPAECGYTELPDLPSDPPARALSDNLDNDDDVPTAEERDKRFDLPGKRVTKYEK